MTVPRLDLDPALKQRRTAADYVADSLRAAIDRGEFRDGEELNQVQLAEHYGMSRVPVREALRRLQAEGLVNLEAHRRAVVVGFSVERILEIFDIRAMLEGYMLQRAAPNLDGAALDRLAKLCDEMDAARGHDAWLAKNREFHQTLWTAAQAPTALQLVEQLTTQVERYLRRTERGVDRQREAGKEHREIVEALRAGKVPTARKALERHVAGTRERIRARLTDASGE